MRNRKIVPTGTPLAPRYDRLYCRPTRRLAMVRIGTPNTKTATTLLLLLYLKRAGQGSDYRMHLSDHTAVDWLRQRASHAGGLPPT